MSSSNNQSTPVQDNKTLYSTREQAQKHSEYFSFAAFESHKTETDVDEELWIQLYHHLLLMLARHKSRPIIEYLNPRVTERLDAYLEGCLDDESTISPPSTIRTPEQILEFEAKCEKLYPILVWRIKEESAKNARLWPENELIGEKDREKLWYFRITAQNVVDYKTLRDSCGFGGLGEDVEAFPELFNWLLGVIEKTYTFAKQQERVEGETFDTSPSDKQVVVAKFHVFDRTTNYEYLQLDMIPELRATDGSAPSDAKECTKFLLPDPLPFIIPRKIKGMQWIYNQATSTWVRADGKTWRPIILIREFRSDTMEYIHCHMDLLKLRNANPNDEDYKKNYNQWLTQIRRRVLKEITVIRVHWKPEELRVLYQAINVWCRKNGVENFGVRVIQDNDLSRAVDDVNRVLGLSRTVGALKTQISTAIKRKKGPIYQLWHRAEAMRSRINGGDDVPDDERYPVEAIPLSDDPMSKDDEHVDADIDEDADFEHEGYHDSEIDNGWAQSTVYPSGEPKLYLKLRFFNDH